MTSPDEQQFPRVLIVAADCMGSPTGLGVTLENMFRAWPRTCVAQIHTLPARDNVDTFASLLVDESSIPAVTMARKVLERPESALAMRPAGTMPAPERRRWVGAWADVAPARYDSAVAEFVAAFRPDVIYTPLGGVRLLRLINYVADTARAPVVPHFMDDWLTTLYAGSVSTRVPRYLLLSWVRRVMARCTVALAISPEMQDEYRLRFNIPFHFMGNVVPDDVIEVESPALGHSSSSASPLRLAFVGGTHVGRLQSLVDVASVLESSDDTVLHVYAPSRGDEVKEALAPFSRTNWLSPVAPAEVPQLLLDYDALVHVESFDLPDARYTRLSLSTKIPQYLAAGRPILAYGPKGIASMNHIARSKAAQIVDSRSTSALASAVAALQDPRHRSELGRRGADYARAEHSEPVLSARLTSVLRQATLLD